MTIASVVRAHVAWWAHSIRCLGGQGIFRYDKQDALALIVCTCGRVVWKRP